MKKEVKVGGEEVKEEKVPDENWEKIKEEKMIKAWNLIGWRKYGWVQPLVEGIFLSKICLFNLKILLNP